MVAKQQGLDPLKINHISDADISTYYPLTIGRRFAAPPPSMAQPLKMAVAQQMIIRNLAKQGDCVIVGRCAGVILRELNPLNLFVYADQKFKLQRCVTRAPIGENLSPLEITHRMQQIDKGRAAYRELFADAKWGCKEAYHLCINTTGREIKSLIPALAEYANCWFQ